jgi:hypothetical protein
MDELELRIADLDLEIDALTISLQATTNPDARRWITICLNVCLRERTRLIEQFRLTTRAFLGKPLYRHSISVAI